MTLLAFLFCMGGFAALSLAMPRHHAALVGGPLASRRRLGLKLAGWSGLALGLAASLAAWGLAWGVIGWLGLLTTAAAPVLLAHTWWPRAKP
ncbi:DUF3325 domain-containing protein [Caulobacter endophyticus]|uniref:DUF3325 domain-containing protein n=1 Tax=Caulobacter endophyticus TaxID=2172652 RepID=UPI0011B2201F|nr:DUF3325 domain-containing protein [Caulobacter endophyticus]